MISGSGIDQIVEMAIKRYDLYRFGLLGEYFNHVITWRSALAIQDFDNKVLELTHNYQNQEIQYASEAVNYSLDLALSQAKVSDELEVALREYSQTLSDALQATIISQTYKDSRDLGLHLRRALIRSGGMLMNSARSSSKATLGTLINDPTFRFMDRSGKQWNSSTYIRVAYRGMMIRTYQDVLLTVAEYHNQDSLSYKGQSVLISDLALHPNSIDLPSLIV